MSGTAFMTSPLDLVDNLIGLVLSLCYCNSDTNYVEWSNTFEMSSAFLKVQLKVKLRLSGNLGYNKKLRRTFQSNVILQMKASFAKLSYLVF